METVHPLDQFVRVAWIESIAINVYAENDGLWCSARMRIKTGTLAEYETAPEAAKAFTERVYASRS